MRVRLPSLTPVPRSVKHEACWPAVYRLTTGSTPVRSAISPQWPTWSRRPAEARSISVRSGAAAPFSGPSSRGKTPRSHRGNAGSTPAGSTATRAWLSGQSAGPTCRRPPVRPRPRAPASPRPADPAPGLRTRVAEVRLLHGALFTGCPADLGASVRSSQHGVRLAGGSPSPPASPTSRGGSAAS